MHPKTLQNLNVVHSSSGRSDISLLVSLQRECLQAVKKVEASNSAIRKEQTSIAKAIKELEELMREGQKKSFTLKGSGYEVNVDVCNLSMKNVHLCIVPGFIASTKEGDGKSLLLLLVSIPTNRGHPSNASHVYTLRKVGVIILLNFMPAECSSEGAVQDRLGEKIHC